MDGTCREGNLSESSGKGYAVAICPGLQGTHLLSGPPFGRNPTAYFELYSTGMNYSTTPLRGQILFEKHTGSPMISPHFSPEDRYTKNESSMRKGYKQNCAMFCRKHSIPTSKSVPAEGVPPQAD